MVKTSVPSVPFRELPAENWQHYPLYRNVREAIVCLPIYFRTETHISGIMATDLHTLKHRTGCNH